MSATCLGMCTRERRRTSRLRSICAHVMLPAPAKGMALAAPTRRVSGEYVAWSVGHRRSRLAWYRTRRALARPLHSIGGIIHVPGTALTPKIYK